MKLLLEILIAVFLHPIAAVLMWIDLANRADLSTAAKIIWAIVGIVWGLGPILYLIFGGGVLWGRGASVMPGERGRNVA